jgi:pimeloyl-ACP methyl ester carboxylesterase
MAARRRKINHRLPAEWADHLVEHGSVPCEGGFAWKFDPVFGVGLPGSFGIEHLDAEHELVECPVLALTGSEHDTWSDLDDAEVARRVANLRARHEVIVGAGHYLHVEDPDAVLDAVARFLDEVDP